MAVVVSRAVMPGTKMSEHSGNEKSVVWSAVDFAEERQKNEMFCLRFASIERASYEYCYQPTYQHFSLPCLSFPFDRSLDQPAFRGKDD